jgi:hypothetical protein
VSVVGRVDGRRRVAAVTAAAVVAGVLTVSSGAGGAHATGRGAGPGGHGRSGAVTGSTAAHARPVSEARKRTTLATLYGQGTRSVDDITDWADTPEDHNYQPVAGAAAVRQQFHDFLLTSSAHVRETTHPMVIAYRDSSEAPQAHLILPAVKVDGRTGTRTEVFISDAGEDLSYQQLQHLEGRGYRFYTKTGTVLPPLESRAPIWWPAGNQGKTRKHFDTFLQGNTVRSSVLRVLYGSDNHEQVFTVRQIIAGMGDPRYDANNAKHLDSVGVRATELLDAGLIKHVGPMGAGHTARYRALTAGEIQERDALPIMERVRRFRVGPNSTARRILNHMYERVNRGREFSEAILVDDIPDIVNNSVDRRGRLLHKTLRVLQDAALIELIRSGVPGRGSVQPTYRAFPPEPGEA